MGARVVGAGLSITGAGLLAGMLIAFWEGSDWQFPATLLAAAALQITALLTGRGDSPVGRGLRPWLRRGIRLVATVWCAVSALFMALSVAASIHSHGMTGLVIPGSSEAAMEAAGWTRSAHFPDLALATLIVAGQVSGAIVLLGSIKRPVPYATLLGRSERG